ncbi:hypothetical protein RCCS2_11182 [Roseobacter sp. CCS2]|nr:hypothetical protein RCCS2_11182 [Roseobacter sp. CCS2]
MLAAQNNADWYAMMWDVRGSRYIRDRHGFRAIDPPPPYHGWATTVPDAPIRAMIEPLLGQPGFAVKDGSGQHDLTAIGLKQMFNATWLWHAPDFTVDVSDWVQVDTPAALARWEQGWGDNAPTDQRQFPDAILSRADVRIWGRQHGDRFDAGVIANLSDDCVGLSNSFGTNARASATALCAGFGQGRPVVGYERGSALTEALKTGWEPVGPLTVWNRAFTGRRPEPPH